jgi:hypothetical protein
MDNKIFLGQWFLFSQISCFSYPINAVVTLKIFQSINPSRDQLPLFEAWQTGVLRHSPAYPYSSQ